MTRRPTLARTLLWACAAMAMVATSCGGGSADTVVQSAADSAPAAIQSDGEASTNPAADQAAPAEPAAVDAAAEATLVANTVSGGQIDFGSLEGQDVVLWFWAPW